MTPNQKRYKLLNAIEGVIDEVETKDSEHEGKYFIIAESPKIAQAGSNISRVIGALNIRLRNPLDSPVKLVYREYLMLKSGISAGAYIAQLAAWYVDLFDNEPITTSLICQVPMTKMSFTIDKTVHFPPLNEKTVAWSGGDKDDATIESINYANQLAWQDPQQMSQKFL